MASATFAAAEQQMIDEYFAFVSELVREAGEIVREGYDKSDADKGISAKVANWDMVTEYDKKTEDFLISSISEQYPAHKFIAEESANSNQLLSDEPTWIIDPIDGTNNFCQRIPFVAISVAFVWKREICIGIVYNPVLREFHSARLGAGAFLNGKPIRCSQVATIEAATLGHEVSFIRLEKYRERNAKQVHAFASASKGFRSFGTCAVSLAFVARGTLDGYQVSELFAWDIAAGVLLVREAGGFCTKPDGSPIDLNDPRILCAATDSLARELIALNKTALEA